jgi:tetratricopeptide (TPR) repeat protein
LLSSIFSGLDTDLHEVSIKGGVWDQDPNLFQAWNNKGNALDELGRYEEAIECYDKALELDPNLTVAQENRDLAYKQSKSKMEKTQKSITENDLTKNIFWYVTILE